MISIQQRFFSALLYIIPLSDALNYGYALFTDIPFLKLIIYPVLPVLYIQQILPFGGIVIFLFLLLGIAKNKELSYFMRYNAMQVILLKLALIIFGYLNLLVMQILNNIISLQNIETIIFIITLSIVIFAIIQCLRGIEADLPGISSATKMQI